MAKAEDQIRAVIEERIAALREKDAGRAIAVLADDVIAFDLGPPLALAPAVARDVDSFAEWFGGFEEIAVNVRDLHVEASGSIGFAHALYRLSGTRGGRGVGLWMRSTLCFRRESNDWRIAHAHTSVPMLLDGTFKAAVMLTP